FVTFIAALLGAIAAFTAVREKQYWEGIAWLILAYLIPANGRIELAAPNRIAVVLGLAALAAAAMWAGNRGGNWAAGAVGLAAVLPFFAIPVYGKVTNYPALHNRALAELCDWARSSTPKTAVFLFPDAKQELQPGVFRAEALRTVYVDWKAGGQVNYFRDFGE